MIRSKRAIAALWTPERILEIKNCSTNPAYFLERYGYHGTTTSGVASPINFFPYQRELLNKFEVKPNVIVAAARGSRITTTTALYALWLALFSQGKTYAICAIDHNMARYLKEMLLFAYNQIPSWLKPKLMYQSASMLHFDNDSSIKFGARSSDFRSMHITKIFIDAMSERVDSTPGELAELITTLIPMTTGVVITGVPTKGHSLFNELYTQAAAQQLYARPPASNTSFSPHKIKIDECPYIPGSLKDTWKVTLGRDEYARLFLCEFQV